MTNIEKIRQEIERRLKYTHDWLRGDEKRHPKQTAISKNYYKMKGDERTLDALLAFIDSLPEEKPSEDLEGKQMIKELKERIVGLDNNGNPIAAAPPDIPMIVEKVNEIIRYLNATQRK